MTSQASPRALIEQLRLLAAEPGSYFQGDAQKREFQKLARQAETAVEEPFETMQRLVYAPLPLVTARIGHDGGIFDALAKSPEGAELEHVSKTTGLPGGVLESVLDYLCTQGMALESQPGMYKPTPLTHMLLTPLFQHAVTHFHDNCLPAFSALNKALGTPEKGKTAFQIGQHSEEDFCTWMETHPIQQDAFDRFTEARFATLPTWLDAVSLTTELAQDAQSSDVLFVDVGGGNGSQCAALRKAHPELPGRIILQGRPAVLEKALRIPGLETMAHDFLTEQPVHNARAYYLGQILHNHTDDSCIHMLQMHLPALQHRPASRLYIDDKILPDAKPPASGPGIEYTSALSLVTTAMFGVQERRERHWRWLVDQAGMEVVDVVRYTEFGDGVLVVRRRAQDGWR